MSEPISPDRVIELWSADPLMVGHFRLHNGVLECLEPDGSVKASYVVADVKMRLRGERSVGAFVMVAVFVLLVDLGLLGCGGTPGLCIAVPFTLVVGALALFMLVDRPEIFIKHADGEDAWPLKDADYDEVDLLVSRCRLPNEGGAPKVVGEDTYSLFFTSPPPRKPKALVPTPLVGRQEPRMLSAVDKAHQLTQTILQRRMNSRSYAVMRHIQHTRFLRSVPADAETRDDVLAWLDGQSVVVLRKSDHAFLDAKLRILTGIDVEMDADAALTVQPDAKKRRALTNVQLEALGLRKVPMPPLRGEAEVELRKAGEVALRVLALGVISMKASTAGEGMEPPVEAYAEMWGAGLNNLTPAEARAFRGEDPTGLAPLAWRFEAMVVLAWALGWIHELPPLSAQAPPEVAMVIPQQFSSPEAVAAATLRPMAEILDALDAVVCRRWLMVDATHKQQPAPPGMNASVLLERHYALNWLVQWEWADWDNVDCPT